MMQAETLKEWHDRLGGMSDEPWYETSKRALPNCVRHAESIERVFGPMNCKFELFDLGHQLGVIVNHPYNGKIATARIKHEALDISMVIAKLKADMA